VRTRGVPSQDGTAWRDFHGGNTSCVQHQQSVAVGAPEHAGVLCEGRDEVLDELGFVARIRLVVPDVQRVTADEADPKDDGWHVSPQ
jgi:hypothetical protein